MSAPRRERKVVTVVFADLVGFTSRAETLDPEDVEAILRPYHERLRMEFERYGGVVEKFIGDAVMAVFGAPVAHEDDAERAVRAALEIRDWALDSGEVDVRVAVNTGEALVSLDARPQSGEAMVAGDVVNTAARMQSAAPVNGVLIGDATYRATSTVVDAREHAPIEAKGKSAPVRVWEAVAARSRFGVDTTHGGAALVGRERELTLLRDALDRARAEQTPQLVTLVGVPGIGKSRLVHELMQIAAADPERIRWRQGRCLPYGEGVTFWALGEIVKAHAGIFETDDSEAAAAKLRAAVAEAVGSEDALWIERELAPLVGLAGDRHASSEGESRAATAWVRFLEALADDVPLVLVLEDLHWADDSLLDFVDELVDRAAEVALLVVATARPELLDRRPGWGGGKGNALTLSLSPLPDDDTSRLIASLLPRALLPAEVQQAVLSRAEGNPLFAEQYAQMLAEQGDEAELHVPETVHGIIAARLDALTRDEKELLQNAAVHGKVFWAGAAAAMGGPAADALDDVLRALERKEFLRRQRRSSVAGETEYTFRHALLRDVAYGQIPRAERAQKHQRAAEWIEALSSDRDDHIELSADHYAKALELARAAGLDTADLERSARAVFARAAARALSLYAYLAARRFGEAAVALSAPDDPERPQLLALRARALHHLGDETGTAALEEARDALLGVDRVEDAAELEALLGVAAWYRGRGDLVVRHMARAAELLADRPPSLAKARVAGAETRFAALGGRIDDALAAGEEAIRLAREFGDRETESAAYNSMSVAHMIRGDVARAKELAERALELALEVDAPELARVYNNMISVYSAARDDARSSEVRILAYQTAERFGDENMLAHIRGNELFRTFMRGDWDEALELCEELLEDARRRGGMNTEVTALNSRAVIHSARGDDERALADIGRSLELTTVLTDPQSRLPALAVAAGVNVAADRIEEARRYALEALVDHRELALTNGAVLFWMPRLAHALGLEDEVAAVLRDAPSTLYSEAARAFVAGSWEEVIELFGNEFLVGAAEARLFAARRLVEEGRRAEADRYLHGALEFFRRAGATRKVREAEALLRATA